MEKKIKQQRVADIRDYLSAIGSPVSQAQGYEVLARAHGVKDANTLAGVTSEKIDSSDATAVEGVLQYLAKTHHLSEVEVTHALASLENDYGVECQIPLENGRVICCPAYPEECSYIRITLGGFELGYWVSDEVAEDPMLVLGAILGLAKGS